MYAAYTTNHSADARLENYGLYQNLKWHHFSDIVKLTIQYDFEALHQQCRSTTTLCRSPSRGFFHALHSALISFKFQITVFVDGARSRWHHGSFGWLVLGLEGITYILHLDPFDTLLCVDVFNDSTSISEMSKVFG